MAFVINEKWIKAAFLKIFKNTLRNVQTLKCQNWDSLTLTALKEAEINLHFSQRSFKIFERNCLIFIVLVFVHLGIFKIVLLCTLFSFCPRYEKKEEKVTYE